MNEKKSTKSKIILNFKKHKLGVFSFYIIIILYLTALFSEFLSPYSYKTIKKDFLLLPPSKIHIFSNGKIRTPFIYGNKKERNKETYRLTYEEDKSKIYPIKLFVKGDKYFLFGLIPASIHLFGIRKYKSCIFFIWF